MRQRHGLRRLLGGLVVGTLGLTPLSSPGVAQAATADSVAPVLASTVAEPATVDASQAAVPVVVTARLTDAGSGTTQALVRLGDATSIVALSQLSGTPQDGIWTGIVSVPAGTPPGPVHAELTLTDAAGNSTKEAAEPLQDADQEATASPTTVPDAPAAPTVTAGDAAATVSWAAPAADGGEAPYAYLLVGSPSNQTYVLPGSARSAEVGRLANGVATTFTVTAVNGAGSSAQSMASTAVTPRAVGTLVVVTQPAVGAIYGTASVVTADLRTASADSVGGRRVDLLALVGRSTSWRQVATATSNADGLAVLRAVLPANSALMLRHPADAISAADVQVRRVLVSTRVSATPRAARVRQGMTVLVRGGIAPSHPVGSLVHLQRKTSKGWVTIAAGRMTTTTAYSVAWKPATPTTYPLRVVKPADADHAAGTSPAWLERVDPENVMDVARAIRANRRITLANVHAEGARDRATSDLVMAALAAGRLAPRSSYGNAPGGSTRVDLRLLKALRRIGQLGTVTVSEITGGSHTGGSEHYAGRGLDINWVNGRHVGGGASYSMVIATCRAFGANQIFSPSYDPYGGHGTHVHCGWS